MKKGLREPPFLSAARFTLEQDQSSCGWARNFSSQ